MGPVSQAGQLLEREAELAGLSCDLEAARTGAGQLVLLEGAAGIGKTTLIPAVRARAEAAGMAVAQSRGTELESGFAFGVVRQLFEPLLRACSQREREQLLSGPAGLAGDALGAGDAQSSSTGHRLHGVMHGLHWLALNLTERRPLLALVDDAHWADPASLRFVAYLAGRLEGAAVLAVVAVRRVEGDELTAASREATTRVVRLKPLSAAAAAELLRYEYREEIAPEFAEACHKATDGNPFYLHELAHALRADGIAPTTAQAHRVGQQGPASVARSLLTRIAGLSPAAPPVARALAVLGGEADLRAVAALSSLDEDTVAPVIDALAGAGIVAGSDPVAFAHPIVCASIYSDIPANERERAHLRAARLLADWGTAAERVAVHLLPVRTAGDTWRAGVLWQGGQEALLRGAPDSAVTYLSRALLESPASNQRHQLVALLGRAEYLANQPGASGHLIEAMDSASTVTTRGELALHAAKAMMMLEPDRSQAAVDVLDRAITELGAPDSQLSMRLEAHLLAAAGLKLATRPIHIQRLESVYAKTLGEDPAARLLLANLAFWAMVEGTPGRFADLAAHADGASSPGEVAVGVAERAIAEGQLLREEGSDSELFYFAVATLRLADHLDSSQRWLDQAIDEARKRGSVLGYGLASARQAEVAYRRGRLVVAEAHARAAAEISREDAVAVLVNIAVEQGRLGEARQLIEPYRMPPEADHLLLQDIRAADGRLKMALGRHEQATNQLLACGRWLEAWPANNPSHIAWRSTAGLALTNLGRHDQARQLAAEEVALARGLGQARALGVALRALGLIERGADGIDLLGEAITQLERSPARLEHARALVDYGAAIRRNGHRADAQKPLREGLDLAHRCGATALTDRACQELAATGARPRRPVLSGRDSLTPTEARVAHMAARGQSTPEIAQALFVSPKTVETHLGHAFRKLDIHTRAELKPALLAPGENATVQLMTSRS